MPNTVERVASKVLGTTKAVRARVKGLRGVFMKLSEEHGEVAALLKRVSMSSDPKVRSELFPTIRKQLLAHEKSELKEVYPVFSEYADTRAIAQRHSEEAGQLEMAIKRLDAIAYDDPSWESLFKHLVSLVETHVHEEENTYFPAGMRVLGDRAEELAARYTRCKKELLKTLSA